MSALAHKDCELARVETSAEATTRVGVSSDMGFGRWLSWALTGFQSQNEDDRGMEAAAARKAAVSSKCFLVLR